MAAGSLVSFEYLRPCVAASLVRRFPFSAMRLLPLFAVLLATPLLQGADQLLITASHSLEIARPSETITVPWVRVAAELPGALLQKIAVRNSAGEVLAYQVTNVAPQAKDPGNRGVAYGELIFQHSFAAGEKTATFTVEQTNEVAPVFPTKAFARYIAERLDDFAWENDRIAHRTYGPALAAPAQLGITKEVLVTSGLDVWCKRVSYPIVDRWYNKGHDHYHKDEGEGMDMYQVGPSRGCGGTGIWSKGKLYVGRNYQRWKILANGPVRTCFELSYDAWDADGIKVTETKRITLDAGHQLNVVESTFNVVEDSALELVVGIGLNRASADKGQDATFSLTTTPAGGWMTQWIVQKTNGSLGTTALVPASAFAGFAVDDRNELVLAKVTPGKPLRYAVGAGWSRASEFSDQSAWNDYVSAFARRLAAPLQITYGP